MNNDAPQSEPDPSQASTTNTGRTDYQRRRRAIETPDELKRMQEIHARITLHPVGTEVGLLDTRPVDELYLQIKDELLLSESGLYVGASSGDGKSAAIQLIVKKIGRYFRPRAIGTHDFLNRAMPAPVAFHSAILSSLGVKDAQGSVYRLQSRLEHTIVQKALDLGDRQFILFLDEAQVVTNPEFQYLKDLENAVARHKVKLMPILFGENPMLASKILALKESENYGAAARFGSKGLKLRSYSSLDDIFDILDQIDEKQDAEGVYWTEFFFPNAFNGPSKFRLANQTEEFYAALLRLCENAEIYGFAARPFFASIRSFMLTYMTGDPDPEFPPDAWDRVVNRESMHDLLAHKQSRSLAQTGKALRPAKPSKSNR